MCVVWCIVCLRSCDRCMPYILWLFVCVCVCVCMCVFCRHRSLSLNTRAWRTQGAANGNSYFVLPLVILTSLTSYLCVHVRLSLCGSSCVCVRPVQVLTQQLVSASVGIQLVGVQMLRHCVINASVVCTSVCRLENTNHHWLTFLLHCKFMYLFHEFQMRIKLRCWSWRPRGPWGRCCSRAATSCVYMRCGA